MIQAKNLAPFSAARTLGRRWFLPVMNTSAAYHFATPLTLNGQLAGQTVTGFAAFYTKNTQSLFVTPVFGGALTALTLRLTGLNQFGETVTELLVFAAATATQTALCYTRVTGLTIVSFAGTPGAADTVTIGYSLVNPRVPLLAKLAAAGSVLAVADVNQGTLASQPTIKTTTINPAADTGGNSNIAALATGVHAYNILLTGTLITATNGTGEVRVYLNDADPAL